MILLIPFAILLIIVISKTWNTVREWNGEGVTWISRLNALSAIAAWAAASILMLLLSLASQLNITDTFVLSCWIFIATGLMTWGTDALLRSMKARGHTTLAGLARARWDGLVDLLRNIRMLLAPPGVKEIGNFDNALDRITSVRGLAGLYLGFLLLTPVMLAPIFVLSLEQVPSDLRPGIRSILGFNGLAVIACVTLAFIVTLMILAIVCRSELLLVKSDIPRSFGLLTCCIGYSSMAGLLTGALVPLFAGLPGSRGSDPIRVSPMLLIELPAAFAIIGAAVGMIVGVCGVLHHAENLCVRRYIPAGVFSATVLAMHYSLRITPHHVFRCATSGIEKRVASCQTPLLERNLSDGAFMIHYDMNCHGQNWILNDAIYAWTSVALMALIATGLCIHDLIQVNRARHAKASIASAEE